MITGRGVDFHGLNTIAFRRMNQMDISGNVVTESEYLPSLKVCVDCYQKLNHIIVYAIAGSCPTDSFHISRGCLLRAVK